MIRLERVTKVFASADRTVRAVDDVSFEVAPGEICALIGPSGCGKTTTMRMINRLELPTSGRIMVDGQDVASVDAVELRRRIGYVIQQIGLFPHMTVADNVAIVPRLLGWPADRRRRRAEELLELVGLEPEQFADRYPRQLSGGQQQRVGVARALAADPPIILMDEPFGAVDRITRKQLQWELRRIQAEVHKTIVFVTHDIGEAFLLGNRIVLLADGRVVQQGPPQDLLRRPADPFVTSFIGENRAAGILRYTTLAELARPATEAPRPGVEALPATLSVLEALRRLGRRPDEAGDAIWVADPAGGPTGRLTYRDLVVTIGEAMPDDALPR